MLRILDTHGLPFLESVLAGEVEVTPSDKIRAFEAAGKYALGTQKEITVEHVREKLMETIRVIREELPDDAALRVLSRIRPIWR